MRYVLLIHQGDTPTPYDQDAWAALPDEDKQAIFADYQAINDTPGVTPGLQMQPPAAATTIRVRGGGILATDGPFAETKEALGGWFVYETDDPEAVRALAARVPAARYGGAVEIRPLVG